MTEPRTPRTIAQVPAGHERVRLRQRAYLTRGQAKSAARLFGCIRVVQNDALAYAHAEHQAGRPYPGATGLQHHVLTVGKQRPERAWLNEVSGVALIQAIRDVDQAYRNFFGSITGTRKGARVGFPRRKKKTTRAAARFSSAARFTIHTGTANHSTGGGRGSDPDFGYVRLPKIGEVRFRLTQPLDVLTTATSVTLIREADGRFHLSFTITRPTPTPRTTSGEGIRATGIDVGLSTFATTLTRTTTSSSSSSSSSSRTTETAETAGELAGELVGKIATPAYLRRRARALARSQRALSRKQKGSANRAKARHRVAVAHRKVRDARLDHAHQHAARLVSDNDVIAIEDLHIRPMTRGTTAKSVHDQAMGRFLRILTEKATRHGVTLIKVGRFYPSTQLCSACGDLTGPRGRDQLHVRTWTCGTCTVTHDRDTNAARNILTEGLRLLAHPGQHTTSSTVADGQSETLNASQRSHQTPGTPDAGPATLTPGETEAGSTTGEQPHAAA